MHIIRILCKRATLPPLSAISQRLSYAQPGAYRSKRPQHFLVIGELNLPIALAPAPPLYSGQVLNDPHTKDEE